jgi:hypothetical protein
MQALQFFLVGIFFAMKFIVITAVSFSYTRRLTRTVRETFRLRIFFETIILAGMMTWEYPVERVLCLWLTGEIFSIGFETLRAFFNTLSLVEKMPLCAF